MNSIDRPVRRVWQSFLNKLFSRSTRPAQKRRRFVPAIESLEKRELLSSSPVWTPIGPAPILGGQTAGSLPVSGRVTGVATDPQDANTIFIASAGGGVWKTTNGGTSWSPLTDSLFTDANGNTVDAGGHPLTDANGTPIPMFMGAIAETRDSSGHEIVYAGTGEANNSPDNYYGLGILASTDGGATWRLRYDGGAFVGATVAKIAIDPSDTTGQTVYAAIDNNGANAPQTVTVATGIYKSADGGATWTNVTQNASLSTTDTWSDVVIDPINHNLFAAVGTQAGSANNGVYSAPAGGTTWSQVSAIPSGTADGRITLALHDDGTTSGMFVAITNPTTKGLAKMLRSTDGETTFTDITANVTSVSNYLGTQGQYDTTLAIDPANPNYIYAGGDMTNQGPTFSGSPLESFDRGNTWHDIGHDLAGNGPHSDDHAVAFDVNGNLIDGNDGGVFELSNPTSQNNQRWSSLNTNLQITQFTSVAVDPQNSSIVYGGSQDNATEKSTGPLGWQRIDDGDGGVTRVAPTNSNVVYDEYVNVALQVSINGSAFSSITNGMSANNNTATPPQPIVNFYAPYVLDASGAIYYGTDYLNFTPNPVTTVGTATNVSVNWSAIGTPGVNNFNPNDAPIDAIAVAPSNNNVVYVSAGGKIFVTQNAQAGGANVTWQQIGASFGNALDGLTVDPNNPGTAYAVINRFSAGSGNHVFMTTNFGAPISGPVWTDISGNLYNSPVNAVALSADGSRIFVGNDVGVYTSGDGGATWARLGTGLPNAQVVDLELVPSQNLIVAGTHGRGAWETSVAWVTNTNDSGAGSLRQAIVSGASVIDFDIPTTDPGYNAATGAFTISALSGYAITNPVVIDGTTQPGFSGQPLIELDGANAGSTDGLEISAGNTTVTGLAINRFAGNGIALINQGSDVIAGDYIGTDPSGTIALGNGLVGLLVNSSDNTIGGATTGSGNLISGNGQHGLQIFGSGATGNVVEANFIGTDRSGATALPNGREGIVITGGANGNIIGGTSAAAANVLSGNTANGVQLNGTGTVSNIVEGNFIGTDSTGATAVPNQGDGVLLNQGATSNTIGGTSAAAANVISGNMQVGVELDDTDTTYNLVEGNFIGTDHTGATALPNQSDGVFIGLGAGNNTIGGTFAAAGNVISGNSFAGVKLDGSGAGNVVTSNFIGTTAAGASALPNQGANIEISASASSPISPANILLIQMGGNTQNITLQVDPNRSSDIDVLQSGAVTPLAQFSLSSFTAIDVVGSGALTLDYSNGSFGMPIDYQGVTPASLAIVGNSSIAFTSTGANSGSFVVNRDTANPVTFTNVTVLPTITLQPHDLLAAKGMTAVFRASATNAEGQPLSVQWQVSTDGNNWAAYTPPLNPPPNMPPPVTFYTESTGQTTTTLSFEVDASQVGQEFRAAFSDDGGVHYVNTSPANLIVAPVVTADGTTYNVTYWVGGGREYDDGPLTGDPNSWNYPYNWTDGIPGPNTVAVFDFNVPRYGIANSQGLPTEYFTTPVVYNGTDGTFQPTLYACNVDVVAKVGGIYLATGFAFVDSSGNVTPGTVNVYQPLELTGGSEWDNGNINVSSGANPYLVNDPGAQLTMNNVNVLNLAGGGILSNHGVMIQTGSAAVTHFLQVNGGTVLSNQVGGTFDMEVDGGISADSVSDIFNNYSLVEKTAGTGTSTIGMAFDNLGATVDAESGTLVLGGGGASTGGKYNAAAGAVLDLAGASGVDNDKNPTFSGIYSGTGAGTVGMTLGGSINIGTAGATLDFPLRQNSTTTALFQVSNGSFNFHGNTLTNADTMMLTNAAGTPVLLTSVQYILDEQGGTLVNTGTIVEQGLGGLTTTNNVNLNNQGVYQFTNDGSVTSGGGGGGNFNNLATGLVKKTAGYGTSNLALPFNNQGGTVDAESGTLVLGGGGTSTGGTYIANDTNHDATHPNGTPVALDLAGSSTPYFTGTYTGSGSGNIELAQGGQIVVGGATLNFPNLVVSNGGFNLLGNTLTNIGTMTLTNPAGTPVLVVGVNGNSATGGTLSNMGLIEEKGLGGLDIGYAITLSNSKTIQFDNDVGVTGGAGTFNNLATGLVLKAAATGTSSLAIPFNNQGGTVDAEAGTLVLGDGGASTGGMYIANGTNPDGTPVAVDLAGSSTPYFTGTYTGSGSGNIELAQGGQIVVGGATLNFPNLVVSNGGFNLLGNTLTNIGTMTLTNPAGTPVLVVGVNGNSATGGTLSNMGLIEEKGLGGLDIGYAITLSNSKTIQFDNDVGVTGGAGTFNNLATGLVEKFAGTGTSSVALAFNNQGGTVDAESGTLVLSDGGTSTGGTYITNGTNPDGTRVAVDLAGTSSPYFTGTYTGSGSGNIELAQGGQIIVGGATLDFPNLVVSNGSFNVLNNTLTNAGTLNLTNAAGTVGVYANYPAGTFKNTGTIDVQGAGGLAINYYVTLNNSGVLQLDGDGSVTTPGGGSFNNLATGRVIKAAGTGTSSLAIPFNNQGGTVDAESGTLVLSGGGTSGGGIYNANGTNPDGTPVVLDLTGSLYSLANAGTVTVTGNGNQVFNGDLNNTGTLILGPSSNFTVNGNYTQGASATLDAQLGGAPASGQFGQMTVSPGHTANLDGTLQAELVGGFQPGGGDSFTVMSYDTNQGSTFQHFSLPTNLQPQVGAQTVTLTQAIPTSFGNLNLPTIPLGTVNTLISGQLVPNPSSAVVPAGESVQVTLDGVTQDAPLDATDHFATTFDTATLGATHSPYAISFGYPGDTTFLGASGSSTLTVTPATPTLSWSNPAAIVYGTALSATELDATANTGGLFTYTLANGATPASGAVLHAGVGQILNVSFVPTDTIDFTSATGQATIAVNPKTLTASIVNDPTKTYDGSNAATLTSANFLLAGLIGSESFTVTQGAGTYDSKDTNAATASAILSAHNFSTVTGTLVSDYTLPTTASGAGTISATTLTAAIIGDPTKSYDGATTATLTPANFQLSGLVGAESFTVTQTAGVYNGKDTDADTISAALSVSDFSDGGGALASDYALPTSASGAGAIVAKPLTAAILGDPTKTYDGTTSATLTPANFQLNGLAGAEKFTVAQTTGTYDSKDTNAATVSTTLSPGDFTADTGTLASDYTLPTITSGAGTISPRMLTAAIVGDPSKTYDGTTAATLAPANFQLSGLVVGETFTVTQTVGACNGKDTNAASVSASLSPSDFTAGSGTLTGDYALPTTVGGAGTISPKALTAAIIGAPAKVYDGTTAAALTPSNFVLTGLVGTESFTVTQTAGAYNSKDTNAATVSAALSASNFSASADTLSANYLLPTAASGADTISAKTLTAAIIDDPTKVYDGSTAAILTASNFEFTGLTGSDNFAITQSVGTYNSKDTTATAVNASLSASNFTASTDTLANDYALPTTASGPGTITLAQQTIDFSVPSPITIGVPIKLSASGGASGNPITFLLISGPATLNGATLTATGLGTVVVEADQAGNLDYAAAMPVQSSPIADTTYSNSVFETANGTPSAVSIATLLGKNYGDADKTTKPGIAVTQMAGAGVWQYLSGTAWTNITAVSVNNALLLPQADKLRFEPAGLDTGAADLLFDAWDGSLGTSGGRANVSVRGGGTPFSIGAGLLTVDVTPVTAALVWLATSTTLAPVVPGGSNAGQSVQQAFGALFSGDNGQQPGVAVVGPTSTSSGNWQFALYNSSTQSVGAFQNMTKISASTALLLGAQDLIRFVPTSATFIGNVTLQVRAWDGTGADGGTANLSKSTSIGGKTDFSSAILTAKLYFNHAPTQAATTGIPLTATAENVVSKTVTVVSLLKGTQASDVDKGTSLGLALTSAAGLGIWQYQLSAGGAWLAVPTTVSPTTALLLSATASLRFVPTANQSGSATLSWCAWDGTQGTAGTQAFALGGTGLATAFSSNSASATLSVTANVTAPAPAWSGSGAALTPVVPNTTPPGDTVATAFGSYFASPGSTVGIAVSGVAGTTNGVWEFSIDGGTTWASLNSVRPSKAILLSANDLIRFRPTKANFLGTATLTAHAWAANPAQDGTAVNLTLKGKTGGTTAIGTTTLTATCLVNTSPTLTS